MKDRHNDLIFHFYYVRNDGKGIDLIIYMFNGEEDNDYTITTKEKYETGDSDFKTISHRHNSEEYLNILGARSEHKNLLNQMPESTKVKRRLQAIENIQWHFHEWFQKHDLALPENYRLIGNLKHFAHREDYSIVWKESIKYKLTRQQSRVIKVLHEAYQGGRPYLNSKTILRIIGGEADKISDVFKTNKDAMNALTHYNKSLTQYKLNIDT